jgi:hypothetical protein
MGLVAKIIITGIVLITLIVILVFALLSLYEPQKDDGEEQKISIEKIKPSNDWGTLLSIAQSDFDANEERADSAPKQTVVALWGIRDTQTILILQNENFINQNYEIAKQNVNLTDQNAILIEISKQKNKLLLCLILSVLVFGSLISIINIWKKNIINEKK